MVAAIKLLHLLEAFSTPWFLFSAPSNHHLVFFLLEIFNNIIQYQFDGTATIFRRRTLFVKAFFHPHRKLKFSLHDHSKASRVPCVSQFTIRLSRHLKVFEQSQRCPSPKSCHCTAAGGTITGDSVAGGRGRVIGWRYEERNHWEFNGRLDTGSTGRTGNVEGFSTGHTRYVYVMGRWQWELCVGNSVLLFRFRSRFDDRTGIGASE